MDEEKTSKYLQYASGEIFLIVLGILIALQINHWNENRKQEINLNTYKNSLVNELIADIHELNRLSNLADRNLELIDKYLKYFNSNSINIDTLVNRLDDIDYTILGFNTAAHSIQNLIISNNLSALLEVERNAILKLNAEHIKLKEKERIVIDGVDFTWRNKINSIDMLYYSGYSSKEHVNVSGWKYNVDSEQYRLHNNHIASTIRCYRFQKQSYDYIKEVTSDLLNLMN